MLIKRLIFILFISSHSFSNQKIEKFQAANARYNDSDYIGAIQLFEEIVSENLQSGYLYYNLGNSYFRAGMVGQSIWAYNKALKLSPRFENIKYNLDSMPARLSKNALKKALNKLKTSDTRSDNFDNKIIYQYLKDKFQLHSSNLDTISTKDQLRGRINDQDLDELIELLKLSESFIYGKKETIDIHSLNQKTASVLERIDKSC